MVNLPPYLLNALGQGKHTIRFVYRDGYAEGSFAIIRPLPPTGDTAHPLLWLGLVIAGGAGLYAVKRKKKHS